MRSPVRALPILFANRVLPGLYRRRFRALPVRTIAACLTVTACMTGGCSDPPATQARSDLAALAASAEGFAEASPDTPLQFPNDHQAHDAYRIEWWYLTANLEDALGQPYGAQWTLFRVAQRPTTHADATTPLDSHNPWQDPQIYMAHFAISTASEHYAFQRYARGGTHGGRARAGAALQPFRAWIDDWYLRSAPAADIDREPAQILPPPGDASRGWLPLDVYAREDNLAMQLRLTSDRPLVLQGDAGFSRKHPNGGGSHYYSHPFLAAVGQLQIDGEALAVTGQAWLDREWSSQFLQADQSGWDWFALHLDSGEKLMLFRLRDSKSDSANYKHGVLISPDGTKQALDPSKIRFEVMQRAEVAGRELPTRWRIVLGDINRKLLISALHPDQWMDIDFPYWEGYVIAEGDGPGESGRGYLEMVGYPQLNRD